jgi:uncharacterized protein YukE
MRHAETRRHIYEQLILEASELYKKAQTLQDLLRRLTTDLEDARNNLTAQQNLPSQERHEQSNVLKRLTKRQRECRDALQRSAEQIEEIGAIFQELRRTRAISAKLPIIDE